jgi:hypothetical protein
MDPIRINIRFEYMARPMVTTFARGRSTAGTPQPAAARPGRQGAAVPRLPPRASRLLRPPGSPLTSARRPAAGRRPSTSR